MATNTTQAMVGQTGEDNAPVSIEFLRTELADQLDRLAARVDEGVTLEPLGPQKDVADSTTKVLVRTQTGQPTAVIICSRSIAPDLVARGTGVAETIRGIIGEELGEAIIRPLDSGYVDSRSYVILPYCRDFSKWRTRRIIQRLRIQGTMLTWLRQATVAAVEAHGSGDEVSAVYESTLRHLEQQRLFDDDIQSAIRDALTRLESGKWKPRHTFDHNDLYLSNIMLPAKSGTTQRSRYPFILIDWAGANPKGFGIYDLVRLSRAFNLSDASLRRELAAHAAALGCDLKDTPGHLLATCGRLHQHIEHFPEDRYFRTVNACWETINRVVPPPAASS